jgi:hypothetical protein
MNIFSALNPITQIIKFTYSLFKRKPIFKITLDNKNLKRDSTLVIGIWVKNSSIIPHDIVKIEGEREGHPNSFKISIVDNKYRLPITLNPTDPEKIIVFICEFLDVSSLLEDECNIIIKVYSRWEGEKIVAGRLKFALK